MNPRYQAFKSLITPEDVRKVRAVLSTGGPEDRRAGFICIAAQQALTVPKQEAFVSFISSQLAGKTTYRAWLLEWHGLAHRSAACVQASRYEWLKALEYLLHTGSKPPYVYTYYPYPPIQLE